jgi:hypothetical protein
LKPKIAIRLDTVARMSNLVYLDAGAGECVVFAHSPTLEREVVLADYFISDVSPLERES